MIEVDRVDILAETWLNFSPFIRFRHYSLFPLFFFRKALKKRGLRIRFMTLPEMRFRKLSGTICIDSRVFYNDRSPKYIRRQRYVKGVLKKLKKRKKKIIWFDTSDSSGTTHFELMPYIDKYCKRILLKDRSLYRKRLYRNRLYTDFYAKRYYAPETLPPVEFDTPLEKNDEYKLEVLWNYAYSDFRPNSRVKNFFNSFSPVMKLNFVPPSRDRDILTQARYTVKGSHVIDFQRKQLLEFTREKLAKCGKVAAGFIPKKEYLAEFPRLKSVLSPFRWGESTWRDFETMLGGAALIKPSMEHTETWPDIYKEGKTYLPIPWDVEMWPETLPAILEDKERLLEVAQVAQDTFQELWSASGIKKFSNHIIRFFNSVGR